MGRGVLDTRFRGYDDLKTVVTEIGDWMLAAISDR